MLPGVGLHVWSMLISNSDCQLAKAFLTSSQKMPQFHITTAEGNIRMHDSCWKSCIISLDL